MITLLTDDISKNNIVSDCFRLSSSVHQHTGIYFIYYTDIICTIAICL